MTIIDGRDSNAVPTTLNEKQFEALLPECIKTYSPEFRARSKVYVYKINGYFVPALCHDDTLILSAEYKTERGVNKWVKRFYPHALQIS